MIRFDRIPIHAAESGGGREVPYLDIAGEDEPTDFLFSLGGQYGMIARSNLHTLRGAPKTGKSAAGLVLITAALSGEFAGISAGSGLRVLWIDTEQDRATLRQKARAVLDMAGMDEQPDALRIVTLRGYGGPDDNLAATLRAMEDNAADFVFLDGVVDICPAFNDEEKSRETVRQLEACAERYGSAILALIHTNKKDDEARGHLGAVMQQKSAEIYQVTKFEGDNVAHVTQPLSRFAPVPEFSFAFADNFRLTGPPSENEARSGEVESMRQAFAGLLTGGAKLTKGELKAAYKEAFVCQDRKAEAAIRAAYEAGVLHREEEGRRVYYSYLFPDFAEREEDII